MAASRSSSGVDLPWPSSRSSSPTVAASSGPIVVLISIRRLLPPCVPGLLCPNICSINGPRESSPRAGSVDGEGDGGQERDDGAGAGEHLPAVLPGPPAPGGLRRRRRGLDPGQAGR